MTQISCLYEQQTIFAIMFSVEDNEFSLINAVSKNTWEKPSYLPKADHIVEKTFNKSSQYPFQYITSVLKNYFGIHKSQPSKLKVSILNDELSS